MHSPLPPAQNGHYKGRLWKERNLLRPRSKSGEVHGETLEIGERAVVEGTFVSSPQDHAGRAARLQRFAPAGRTQAPAVAGPQAAKAEFGHRRRKIIAARFGKLEKRGGHDGADRVVAGVFATGVAAAVTKEPRLGLHRADVEPLAEDIPGRALGRPPPFPLSSLSIADSWVAAMPANTAPAICRCFPVSSSAVIEC